MDFGGDFQGTPRFRLVRELGVGAMGEVYEAHDVDTGATVALKVLHRVDPEAIGRLKAEFRLLQEVQHPGVVSFGELFEHAGAWFFTMELVEGVTLTEHLAAAPPPERPRRTAATFALLADALAAVHGAGLVHRDLKPSNVLCTASGRVVLLDFGLAAGRGQPSRWTGERMVGTAAYLAPEQARGERAGPTADWYAAGVMLYEALTGRLPHDGTAYEIVLARREAAPFPPITDGDPALRALCHGLLADAPEARLAAIAAWRGAPDPGASMSLAGGPAVFVGRDGELARLRGALAEVRGGAPVVVQLIGESGIGKSTLLRQFLDGVDASTPGALVLRSRCHEHESVPFNAVDGVVDALADHLAERPAAEVAALLPDQAGLLTRVFPVLGRVPALADAAAGELIDPHALRTRMFAVLRALLGRIATRQPLVISVDDAQWADDDSVALLHEVVRPPAAPPCLMVLARRSDVPGGERLATLPVSAVTIPLTPLPDDQALALAQALLAGAGPRLPADRAAAIARESAGHPLFIGELTRAQASAAAAPLDLDAALGARIAALAPPARAVLALLAVAGYPLPRGVVAHALDVDGPELQRRLGALRAASLVRGAGARADDRVEPYHARVRVAALTALAPDDRRALHAALARALTAGGVDDPEALAPHLEAAGDLGRAADAMLRAGGNAARVLAFDRAARWLRRAVDLATDAGDARPAWAQLDDVLAAAGRGEEAAAAYLRAVPGSTAAAALDLRRRAAQQYLLSGHITEGLAAITELLTAEAMPYPATPGAALRTVIWNRLRLRLPSRRHGPPDEHTGSRIDLCWHLAVSLGLVDTVRGHVFHTRGLLLARRHDDPFRLSRATAIEAAFTSMGGARTQPAAEALLAEAQALATRCDQPQARAFVSAAVGQVAFLCGEFPRAEAASHDAEIALRERCTGVTWELATSQLWYARAVMMRGEAAALARWLPAALRECDDRGDRYGGTTIRAAVLPFVHLADDDASGAIDAALAARRAWTAPGFHVQHYYATAAEIAARLYRGDLAAAELQLAELWRGLERSHLARVQFIRVVTRDLYARTLIAAARPGDEPRLRHALRLATQLERERAAWARGLALVVRAGVAARRGHDDRAADLRRAAITALDAVDMSLHAACLRAVDGPLRGGTDGHAASAAATAFFARQALRAPATMSAALVPGATR